VKKPILFAGGVARNPCIGRLLEKALDTVILAPEDPQMVGAMGAAVLAEKTDCIPARNIKDL
jgi:(R)-2-hydroxyacyl-CoA dehydratese activating ATPase